MAHRRVNPRIEVSTEILRGDFIGARSGVSVGVFASPSYSYEDCYVGQGKKVSRAEKASGGKR